MNPFENFHIINEYKQNQKRIYVSEYNGHKYIHFREYFKPDDKDEFIPTKKGMTLFGNQENIQKVIEALQEIIKEI